MASLVVVALAETGAASADPAPDEFGVTPVRGRVVRGWDPPEERYGAGHNGILMSAGGGRVRAGLGGVVTFAGQVARTRYVTVRHASGLVVRYGRLGTIRVQEGMIVRSGDLLADGVAPGPGGFLHLSVMRDGRYVDPAAYLPSPRAHLVL